MKFKDNIFLQNCLFICDYNHGNLPTIFNRTFDKTNDLHNFGTRNATSGKITAKMSNSVAYGTNSIFNQRISSWNIISNVINNFDINHQNKLDLNNMSRSSFKKLVSSHLSSSYQDWGLTSKIEKKKYHLHVLEIYFWGGYLKNRVSWLGTTVVALNAKLNHIKT